MYSLRLRSSYVLIALAMAIVLFFAWRWRHEDVKPLDSSEISDASIGKVSGPQSQQPLPRRVTPSGPLPAIEVPLQSTIDDLKSRAARGEAPAACRLAAEFSRCDVVAYRRVEAEQWLAERQQALQLIRQPEARKVAAESIAREMDIRQARDETLESHCRGVPLPSAVENIANWRNAALLGNTAAVRQYASGNAFRWNSLMQALPQLKVYQGEAEQMALQLAKSGDIRISLALADAYDPRARASRSLLAQTLRPDGGRSLALYRRIGDALAASDEQDLLPIKNAVAARVEQLESSLPAQELSHAQDVAERELSQWSAMTLRGAFKMDAPGRQQDVSAASCEQP